MIKRIIVMVSILSSIGLFFSCKEKPYQYKIASVFTEMRTVAFNIQPSELKITREKSKQIYGVFMETGYDDAVFSLRCFAEGSISIYFSNGGGIIGLGEHEAARKTGLDFIKETEKYLSKARQTSEYKLPNPGKTIFYMLTFDGVYSLESSEKELGTNASEFSSLFYKAQDVITQARIIDEKRRRDTPISSNSR